MEMLSMIKTALVLLAISHLIGALDICSNDASRQHARNACSKLVSRHPRNVVFSGFNVTMIPDKHDPRRNATKLTHWDIPGTYFLIPDHMLQMARLKYYRPFMQPKDNDIYFYGIDTRVRDEAEVILFESLVDHEIPDAYEYEDTENMGSDELNIASFESGKHKSLKYYSSQETDSNENDDMEILSDDFDSEQQMPNQEAIIKKLDHESRIKRQNVGLKQCCANPKLDACDWLLCD